MPKVIRSGGRDIILNVKRSCENERDEGGPVVPFSKVRARVAFLTGVSERTVTQITKEGKIAELSSSKIVTPGKNRNRAKMITTLTEFDKCAIRHTINSFYVVKKEIPSINKLWLELKSVIDFKFSRSSLRRILKMMGFQSRKCKSKQKVLLERDDVAAWRSRYLLRLRRNRFDTKRPVIYLDETCLYATVHAQKFEPDADEPGDLYDIVGTRWIIAHAGGKSGFIKNGLHIFKSKSKSTDNSDMTAEKFLEWMEDKIIPNLPPKSLVVMDNAACHCTQINKPPTMGSVKAELQEWLRENNIAFEECWTKAQLYELVKKNKGDPEFRIEKVLQEYGHEAVWLPPNHCDLNPIEKIWTIVKKLIAEKIVGPATSDIVTLTINAFNTITTDQWEDICAQVEKIEDQYYAYDRLLDIELDKLNLNLYSGSEESDSSSEESDDF